LDVRAVQRLQSRAGNAAVAALLPATAAAPGPRHPNGHPPGSFACGGRELWFPDHRDAMLPGDYTR
ncbi:hypothetical protein ACWCQL_26255, partial [Streptomyces sp. NPDC002073]